MAETLENQCAKLRLEIEELNIAKDMLATRYRKQCQVTMIVIKMILGRRKGKLLLKRSMRRR